MCHAARQPRFRVCSLEVVSSVGIHHHCCCGTEQHGRTHLSLVRSVAVGAHKWASVVVVAAAAAGAATTVGWSLRLFAWCGRRHAVQAKLGVGIGTSGTDRAPGAFAPATHTSSGLN